MSEIPSGYNPNFQFNNNFPDLLANIPAKRPPGIYNPPPTSGTTAEFSNLQFDSLQNQTLDKIDIDTINIDTGVLGRFFGMSADRAITPIVKTAIKKIGSAYAHKLGQKGIDIILKNTSKMLPVVGAVTSAKAAYDMSQIAKNAVTPEARFLASYAAKLNAADAALSAAEPFVAGLGVPVVADIALGAAEMVMELEITSIEQDAAQGNYKATPGQHAAIGAIAISNPISGIPELVNQFGVKGSVEIMGTTAKEGLKMLLPKSLENFFLGDS